MTRMIPPTIHSSVKSLAERRLFRIIEHAPGSELWICLHSLGLARHEQKRRAEIDFCLITPDGVFVLEVKGGRVSRRSGVWRFTDRYGNVHTKTESPFDQAATAMFSLEREIKNHLGSGDHFPSICFGYGVLFPDIVFSEVGTEVAREQIFDKRDRRRPFSDYVSRLVRFSRSLGRKTFDRLGKNNIDALAGYLRGDFDLLPLVGGVLDEAKSALAELTREQMLVLDAASDCRRLIVNGPAGSGKTLLAIEAARRAARKGLQVTYLCFNRFLAAMIDHQLSREVLPVPIRVRTLHQEFHALVEASSLYEEFCETRTNADEDELFESIYHEFAELAAMELVGAVIDVLIVDEAQDVLTEPNLRVLNEVLRDGLSDGQWQIFMDANDQASVYGKMEAESLARIRALSESELVLTFNCRNTRPIGTQINIVAQPKLRTQGRIDGPPVEFYTYESDSKILGKLESVLNELRRERIPVGRVSVLFPETPTKAQKSKLGSLGVVELDEQTAAELGSHPVASITWSAVSGFKGLENDVVILVGVRDIDSDWWRSVCYVGLSRARSRLFVIIHRDCTAIREERFAAELARTLETNEG